MLFEKRRDLADGVIGAWFEFGAVNVEQNVLRAEAVRNALLQENVPPEHVIARGMGASEPVASNATVAGRQFNRRVRVAISDSAGRMPAEPSTLSGATAPPAR